MSANPTLIAKFLRGGIVAALLALGACGDGDRTPIVSEAASGQALSLTATGGRGTSSDYRLGPNDRTRIIVFGQPTLTGGRGTSSDYRLGPNDRTRIIVFGQPTLTGEFQLDGNGVLAYPLIGNVDARGMTPSELQQTIAQRLDKDWVHNPSVSVEVSTRRPFYVVGEVQKPGSYPYVTDMSVLNAIATAGGQTYRANMSDFYIKRKQDGRVVRVQATQESVLQPGDTVVVRERYF